MTIRIETSGRMGKHRFEFREGSGAAAAVAKAIQFLSTELFHKAIAFDHEMHDQGVVPGDGFAGYKPAAKETEPEEEEETPRRGKQKRREPEGDLAPLRRMPRKRKEVDPEDLEAVFGNGPPEPSMRTVPGAEDFVVREALRELEAEDEAAAVTPPRPEWQDG